MAKNVSRVETKQAIWVPGYSNWVITAKNENGEIIATIDQDYGLGAYTNYNKIRDFCIKIQQKGYKLTIDQIEDLSNKLVTPSVISFNDYVQFNADWAQNKGLDHWEVKWNSAF